MRNTNVEHTMMIADTFEIDPNLQACRAVGSVTDRQRRNSATSVYTLICSLSDGHADRYHYDGSDGITWIDRDDWNGHEDHIDGDDDDRDDEESEEDGSKPRVVVIETTTKPDVEIVYAADE